LLDSLLLLRLCWCHAPGLVPVLQQVLLLMSSSFST
jgi:hypothetical protein